MELFPQSHMIDVMDSFSSKVREEYFISASYVFNFVQCRGAAMLSGRITSGEQRSRDFLWLGK
jgi:hypothetical protein